MSDIHLPEISCFTELADQEIWNAFRKGNKEALEVIYKKHINELYLYGLKIKGDDSLIKDCIQELFVELWNSKSNLSPTNNIKFYLLRALKYKINHHLAHDLKHKLNQSNFALKNEFDSSYETKLIDKLNLEEREEKIKMLLDQLPARQKEIIHLLFYQELSYEKISELMEINVRSVYTLAWKAISFLRKKVN